MGGVSVGRGMCSEGDWVVVFGWVATKFGTVALVLCWWAAAEIYRWSW